jgi:hypothetical protein
MKTEGESYAWRMFKRSLRLYFAPLRGAYRGVKAEWIRTQRERERERADR